MSIASRVLLALAIWSFPPAPSFASGGAPASACIDGRGTFASYDEAVAAVRRAYPAERVDTSRSSWITSAEYFPANGCGYLLLGLKGRPYIYARVPQAVWDGFRGAPSMGSYYNQVIKGRYRFNL